MEKTKKINSSIDITKLLCAILVVALHVKPFYDVSSALSFGLSHIIARVAVPILFACTGYFFSLKLDSSENKKAVLIQYLKRLFFLYIGWSAIYFVFDILTLIKKFDNFFRAFLYYLRNFLFVGSHFHLWYLPAAMLGLLLLYFAIKTRYLKTFVFICLLLYTIGLFGDSYYGFIFKNEFLVKLYSTNQKIFLTTRNGLFFGFPFLMIGKLVALKWFKTSRFSYLVLSLCSFVLLFAEAIILNYLKVPIDYNIYIMLIPFTFFLMKYKTTSEFSMGKAKSTMVRSYAMGIFFIHALCMTTVNQTFILFEIAAPNSVIFLLVLISSVAVIWVIRKLNIPILRELIR